ncbi:MAG: glycosyltransferase family 4 protein, partial [Chitinophagaceae bacterium]|nr:glycosyltransferase family 4 protein [Chitinophagaceae bacterium]
MSNKKILILCPYPENSAPSQRLKFEQYYPFFREAGYDITISPFVSRSFWKIIYKKGKYISKTWFTITGYIHRAKDIFRLHKYDLVYIHLWVTPLGFPLFERLTRLRAKKIIFDIDDLIYLKDLKSKATPLVSKLKGAGKPLYLMRTSDHVITCTPYLDSFVRKYNSNTTDISSTVDTSHYRPRKDYAVRENKIVLGWSGSHSTSKYLHLLDEVFHQLRKEIDFKLIVIGDAGFSISDIDVEAIAWTEEMELPTISRFDIGLYPLPDEEWVYGKSGLKAIQYMAMGIPTVATSIGTNFRVIQDGESGFLVKDENEW